MEEKDKTNWKAWYWALVGFLALQILLYLWMTNTYTL